MKDFLGRKLSVGDWVVYADASNGSGYFGRPRQIKELKETEKSKWVVFGVYTYPTKKSPEKVLKIPEEDVTFYVLSKK